VDYRRLGAFFMAFGALWIGVQVAVMLGILTMSS